MWGASSLRGSGIHRSDELGLAGACSIKVLNFLNFGKQNLTVPSSDFSEITRLPTTHHFTRSGRGIVELLPVEIR
jgi:hypothetical protein